MFSQNCLLGGGQKNVVRQLNLACAGGLRLPGLRHEETDSGCSDGYSSDSSLSPSSPTLGGPPELRYTEAPPAPEDPLRRRTRAILRDYFRESTGGARAKGADPALRTLRQVARDVADKHRIAFKGMLDQLEIKGTEDLKRVMLVSSLTFEDGVTNWGRIVAVISFGALVAQHLKSLHLESSIDTWAENLTDFLMTHKRDWMLSHNAWEGFIEFFHVEDVEGGIRTVLLTLAGVAGVGASLAYMIR